MTPEIVLGPPGTGKTTALLEIVDEELARGVEPGRVGYFSFTRRAATEAATRAAEKFGLDRRSLRWFRTLHSLAFEALGLSAGDVLEGKKVLEFGDWLGIRLSEKISRAAWQEGPGAHGRESGDRAMHLENLARVRCRPLREQYAEDDDDLRWDLVQRVAAGLRQYKLDRDLVDYTDMLERFAAGDCWAPALEVLIIDEAQDLSLLQWRVVERLARGARRVVVAGDDDQSIYRWAGAAVEHFVALPGDVRVLGQSWRCPGAVQELALRLLAPVRERRPKAWSPRPERGEVRRAVELDDVDLSGEDVLVLVRNAYVARELVEPHLRSAAVIFESGGATSVPGPVLEAVLAWERLRRGESVPAEEVRRAYAQMSVGRGVARGYKSLPRAAEGEKFTLERLRAEGGLLRDDPWYDALDLVSAESRTYMQRALRAGEKLTRRPRVRVSTIHGAKGGEASSVVVLTPMAPRTAREARHSPEDEARVWYVAATRARDRLTVVDPPKRGARYADL